MNINKGSMNAAEESVNDIEESLSAIEESLSAIEENMNAIEEEIPPNPLSENEWVALYEMIDELVVEIIEHNILRISNANVYKEIYEAVLLELEANFDSLFDENDVIDEDVQDLVEQIIDMEMEQMDIPKRSLSMTIDTLENMNENTKEMITGQLTILRNVPQSQQKTKEWYEFRYNLLSASNIWKAVGSQAQQNSIIYEKCKPLNLGGNSMITSHSLQWGNKYEPLSTMIYEDMYQTKIEEFGCIQHPTHTFIGASPDGINVDMNSPRYGRMLEIKNIVNRDITGIPKLEYWIQTQIQMETCNLDTCDFVETRFNEYTREEFYQDEKSEYKGVILHFVERILVEDISSNNAVYKPTKSAYRYQPLSRENTADSILLWSEQMKDEMKMENYVLFDTLYWYLDEFSCVLIQRNRSWFANAISKLEAVWNIILKERVEGYEHRSAKKRQPKAGISMNSETNAYVGNVGKKSSICLVRLDENGDQI